MIERSGDRRRNGEERERRREGGDEGLRERWRSRIRPWTLTTADESFEGGSGQWEDLLVCSRIFYFSIYAFLHLEPSYNSILFADLLNFYKHIFSLILITDPVCNSFYE